MIDRSALFFDPVLCTIKFFVPNYHNAARVYTQRFTVESHIVET